MNEMAFSVSNLWPNLIFPSIELLRHSNSTAGRYKIIGSWHSFQHKLTRKSEVPPLPQKKSMIKPAGLPDVGNASSPKLVVAIASRALFDLDESH